jgi:hypothetical protein
MPRKIKKSLELVLLQALSFGLVVPHRAHSQIYFSSWFWKSENKREKNNGIIVKKKK